MRLRAASSLLYALCLAGLLVALALTWGEAGSSAPIEVTNVVHRTIGARVHVTADVTNTSDVDRCPDVRGVVRDRESRDMAEARASGTGGVDRIAPGATVRYSTRIGGLSAQDRREKVDTITMYVYEPVTCS